MEINYFLDSQQIWFDKLISEMSCQVRELTDETETELKPPKAESSEATHMI